MDKHEKLYGHSILEMKNIEQSWFHRELMVWLIWLFVLGFLTDTLWQNIKQIMGIEALFISG